MSTVIEHAIIQTGGKQYRIAKGDVIYIEKLDKADGETVVFDQILAVFGGGKVKTGNPLTDVEVKGTVVKQGRAKKIIVFKYKAKKNYRIKSGHRQAYTKVRIDDIVIK